MLHRQTSHAALVALLLSAAVAGAAEPTLTTVTPGAVEPGKTVELTLTGANLGFPGEPVTLAASLPLQIEYLPTASDKQAADQQAAKKLAAEKPADKEGGEKTDDNPDKQAEPAAEPAKPVERTRLTFRVTAPAKLAVGRAALWLATPRGASRPLLLLVDDLPSTAEQEENHASDTAQPLNLPAAIDGTSSGASADLFLIRARQGERLAAVVWGARLGTSYDPVLRLLDAKGKELAWADDDAALGADCRLAHTFAAAGDYLLELRDVRYRSGQRYRLRVGNFPLVNTTYPLGTRPGEPVEVTLVGPAATQPASLRIDPHNASADRNGPVAVSLRPAGSNAATAGRLMVDDLPELLEQEPNNTPETATDVSLPAALNGRLATAGDRDYYRFTAAKGDALSLTPRSLSLGSPTYVYLQLQDAAGKALATAGAGEQPEPTLRQTIPADGQYVVMVEDLTRRGGPAHAYRLEIAADEPGFSLSLKKDKTSRDRFLLAGGGALAIDLVCARQEYDGPIALSLSAAGEGLAISPTTIPAGAKAARVYLTAEGPVSPGDLRLVRLRGTAEHEGQTLSAECTVTDYQREQLPAIGPIPVWLQHQLPIAIAEPQEALFTLPATFDPVTLAAGGEAKLALSVSLATKELKDPIDFQLQQLPAGVTVEIKRTKTGPPDLYELTFKGGRKLPPGKHALRLTGFAALANGQGQRAVRDDLVLQIAPEKK